MADKNQLGLANGTPSQFSSANSTSLQPNFSSQSQTQIRYSSGVDQSLNYNQIKKPPTSSFSGLTQPTYSSSMDHSLNHNQINKPPTSVYSGQTQMKYSSKMDHSLHSDQLNKLPTSVFNGQVSPKTRISSWPQQSGHSISNFTSGTGDNTLHQHQSMLTQTQHPSQLQPAKTNLAYSGNINSKVSQNIQPPENLLPPPVSSAAQQNPNLISTSTTQVSSDVHFGEQSIRPSPASSTIENKSVTPNVGTMPPTSVPSSSSGSQHRFLTNVKKVVPPVSPYAGRPPIMGPCPTTQINKPIYGPPLQTLPPKSSPISKPPNSNLLYSNYMSPPAAEDTNSSPQRENPVQGSHPTSLSSRYQYPNVSQSFLQLSQTQTNLHGIPQGYQPQSSNVNQNLRQTSMLSAPPSDGNLNSKQETPTYQNQHTANKVIGPPPTGGVPPPTSVPRLQTPYTNRLPLPNSAYGTAKHSGISPLTEGMERMSVTQQGFNKLWGTETIDLLQCRNILPPQKVTPPPIRLNQEFMNYVNCSPEIFCCTLNKIPETNSLLQKSRLPLGILIHPFRDLSQLAVIQCSSIVRCRSCRTYINPFVYFVDNKRWKCNLCFRVNELPDEFQYDPVSKTYGDPSRRPEIRSSTIEFIAPSEYMLRPPQPAIYLFVLDVSRWGCDTGYLETLCSVLLEELDNIPGDSRTQIGFILFDSTIHFFSIAENYNQAHEMIVTDIDDVFLPTPDSLLVNLNENKQLIKDLLQEIPKKYAESFDTDSALGPALQAAYKLMSPTGGRITVFQSCLPNKGPGALDPREDPNQRSSRDVRHLGPQTDFYKRLSLDCSTQQISVDLFLVSSQYSDLATLGGVSQFSGGCIYHFPLFRRINPESNERLARAFKRYLTRKIGFEAVMRVRCSRGLSIHTFHGNFFVRSTDLLSLPNVNPDAGFGMQIAIEDNLFELQCVCFQAAVLYTSAKGERRIRVHTLCLPVSSTLSDILTSADQQAIVGLLAKMAVDRSLKSNLSDAREAFINAAIDILSAYKLVETSGGHNSLLAPVNLSLIPLYILALLKSTAFRTNQSTKLDDRVYAMSQMKTLPLRELIQLIHPDLYHVTHLDDESGVEFEDKLVPQPAKLTLSSEHLDSRGAFLLDTPEVMYLLVGKNISTEFLVNIFNVKDIRQINKDVVDLPELENDESEKLRHFINFLQAEKPWPAVLKVVTEPKELCQFLVNDKAENALSYYELLHHVKSQLK